MILLKTEVKHINRNQCQTINIKYCFKTHRHVTTATVICPSRQTLRKVTGVTWRAARCRSVGSQPCKWRRRQALLFMIICNFNVCWTSLLVLSLVILFAMSLDVGEKYVSVDFEVFGNVQGGYLTVLCKTCRQ